MWHVLEHVPNLYEQIKELKRLLKPSGTLIVAVPFKSFDAKHYGTFGQLMTCQSIFALFKSDKTLLKRRHAIRKVLPMKFDSFM
jgi:2-polyprenyl-3-methyl-5-hydroxy-6-metoxy-1,4-benzoquinol methylase